MRARLCLFVPTRFFHGKEGVVGSSPTEGSNESPVSTGFLWGAPVGSKSQIGCMETFWKPPRTSTRFGGVSRRQG
jgi:hypothetical protein